MPHTRQAFIYLSVTSAGLQWPARGVRPDSLEFARIPGNWISETEFETRSGDVLLVPAPDQDGHREGPIRWKEADPPN